jgi:hypothetical protein
VHIPVSKALLVGMFLIVVFLMFLAVRSPGRPSDD